MDASKVVIEVVTSITVLREYFPAGQAWVSEMNWSTFGVKYDYEKIKKDIIRLVGSPSTCFFGLRINGDPCGFLCVYLFVSPFSEAKIANERYWFVKKEYRKYSMLLLRRAEQWARDNACSHLMIHSSYLASNEADLLSTLFEKRQYQKFEINFLKQLETP